MGMKAKNKQKPEKTDNAEKLKNNKESNKEKEIRIVVEKGICKTDAEKKEKKKSKEDKMVSFAQEVVEHTCENIPVLEVSGSGSGDIPMLIQIFLMLKLRTKMMRFHYLKWCR